MRWFSLGSVGRREELRVGFGIERGFMPSRGLGISTSGGVMGTEYGDPRHNMTRIVSVQIWWTMTMRICWKES